MSTFLRTHLHTHASHARPADNNGGRTYVTPTSGARRRGRSPRLRTPCLPGRTVRAAGCCYARWRRVRQSACAPTPARARRKRGAP
eukprot:4203662-Pleurochrysis_carterae.AAC.1